MLWCSVTLLEIAFAQKSLRELCASQIRAERKFGITIARKLRARLADLRDAKSINDVIAGRPEKLAGAPETMAVDLGESIRIVFCANHVSNPQTESGEVNWSQVNRIKILDIGMSNG